MVASFRFRWRLVYSICPAHHALVPTRKSAISPIVTRGPITVADAPTKGTIAPVMLEAMKACVALPSDPRCCLIDVYFQSVVHSRI